MHLAVESASDNKDGGVGYEKQIAAAKIFSDQNSEWAIPLIRNNSGRTVVPTFLDGRRYVNFNNDSIYEDNYEKLLRELLGKPVLPIPPLGSNPFETAKAYNEQRFSPSSEKYVSPSLSGKANFYYSNNNGLYSIGQDALLFEVKFSGASDECIYIYNDPQSLDTVAVVKDKTQIEEIEDARTYDGSSRNRTVNLNQIAVLKNKNGFWAAIRIINIKYDGRGDDYDEVVFEYRIQSNGTPDFTN